MKLNKENLLNYLNMKKESLKEMRDLSKDITTFNGYSNQLDFVEGMILELDLFENEGEIK